MLPVDQLFTEVIELERGAFLKVGGTMDTNLYFVEEGSLRLYLLEEEEQIIRLGYRGNFIAALDSVITEQASDIFIQTIKKSKIKVIPKSVLKHFIDESIEHKNLYIEIIESLIVQQMEREQDLLISSPAERYQRVLDRSPQLFQEIPNKHIANYLRMTPETLSRIKKH